MACTCTKSRNHFFFNPNFSPHTELDALGDEMFEDELNMDDAISAPTGPLSDGGEAQPAQVG